MKTKRQKSIQTLFALMIFAVFSLSSLMLCASAISSYRKVNETTQENTSLRSALFYISNKIKSATESSAVSIKTVDGVNILVVEGVYENAKYENLLYVYNGELSEQLIAEGDNVSFNNGNFITPLDLLTVQKINDKLYKIKVAIGDTRDETYVTLLN